MLWNWQIKEWPHFVFDKKITKELEEQFLEKSGVYKGSLLHLDENDKNAFIIDILGNEAFYTSEIEGEILDRASLHSSICKNFKIKNPMSRSLPAEEGIAETMTELYKNYNAPLSNESIYKWHKWLMAGRSDLKNIGCYRHNAEAMQIISGSIGNPKIHFEAPPYQIIPTEMNKYISWFNQKKEDTSLTPLLRAAIGHIYFESIHPFEDGNGRIGRILAVKSLSKSVNQPLLIALSEIIQKRKRQYYAALKACNNTLDITQWTLYFAHLILEAQEYSINLIKLMIYKSKVMNKFKMNISKRQEKALLRIFKEGPDGFEGGMSVSNYLKITNTSRATATRDLQDLLNLGILLKKGVLKSTRYYLRYDIAY